MTKFLHHIARIAGAVPGTGFLIAFFMIASLSTMSAKGKPIDKNTRVFDSKGIELNSRKYDCYVCFTFLIDSKVPKKNVFLRFSLVAKEQEYIDVNGNMLAGSKGSPKFEVEPSRFQREMTDYYHCLRVWYPVEDLEELFKCSKIRLQTKTGNLDLELSPSQMKELKTYYEKASETVTTIFKTKTDITYGF